MIWQSLLGLVAFPAIAWLFSENRRAVRPRVVLAGLTLQLLLAGLLLRLEFIHGVFLDLNRGVLAVAEATSAGTSFVFGYLGGADLPFAEQAGASSFILAFQALPLLLVVSALSALLFYWRVLPWVVKGFAWLLQKSLGVGGALGLGAAANVFVGMTEAPLFIRPYLRELTRSELFALMTCGMATIAGTVMVLYATLLSPVLPEVLGHLLIASVLSAPAALMLAQVMVPETSASTAGSLLPPQQASSSMDAVTRGTLDGIPLLLNVVAMLVVLVALVHLANASLGLLPQLAGEDITLQRLLGWVMAPVVWLMGIPWAEAQTAGALMGVKTVLNEFIAYLQLAGLDPEVLSPRSRLILIYAMCGFANLGSLGIMIGGLGSLVPERRGEVVALGLRSIMAGTLATCLTGALVGIFQG
jgi:CNT family concentrative nucleoside transporter